MKVVYTARGQADLDDAIAYVAQDNVVAAERLLRRIIEATDLLASGLVEGSQVELLDGQRVRTWSVPPYRIYYQRLNDVLEVLRVYHQARRPIEKG